MRQANAFLAGAVLALLTAVPAWGLQADQEAAVDVSGVWEITSESPRGTRTSTVTFHQDGSSLTGTMESQMGSIPIQNGSVEGNKITFTVVFSRGERSFEMTYSGTVDGDTAKGTFQTPRGDEIGWTAKRVEK